MFLVSLKTVEHNLIRFNSSLRVLKLALKENHIFVFKVCNNNKLIFSGMRILQNDFKQNYI